MIFIVGNFSIYFIDNYSVSMNIVISASYLTPFRNYAIKCLDILSRLIGVNYQYLVCNISGLV
ncbi:MULTISPECIES: DUF2612 domain-containing protein [Providencia]|uniref:DUF2612 domain-containing protein n=1 Tax=Providencia TaxID=586 RepID=UPI0012B667FB|nr:DUF2612 domain-containing protein [Providencia stuartii]MTB38760.1 DUF2612 domain-containing protein [Providencia sp. wls1949]MTC09708.1 DUF2612 domain-containing protein [Providencia sp. wls1948]